MNTDYPIDIVIPWVDGDDPEWLREKMHYSTLVEGDKRENRYRDWDILRYVFRSIEENLPWIRTVHFITCGQRPYWLDISCPKLHLVNHKDYIPDKYLPTFSSHPIELNINRIPELSEHFIYANDDTYFLQPLQPLDFFQNGLPMDSSIENIMVFRPDSVDQLVANNLTIINKHFDKRECLKRNWRKWYSFKYRLLTIKNLYLLPIKNFSSFNNPHIPNAFLKTVLNEVWEEEYEILDMTSSHRFRHKDDVNQWLFRYWQLASGRFLPCKPHRGIALSIGEKDQEIRAAITGNNYQMLCLHDKLLDIDFVKEKEFLQNLFLQKFPNKSSFEL